jgi:hypothetical protein
VTQVQEQDEAQDAPAEPVTTEELAEEEAEEEAAHDDGPDDNPFPEPESAQMGSEKDVRALAKKLETERKKHADRLGAILGDAATDALPCPLCFEGLMGFVLPGDAASLPEPQKAAALTFLGQDIGSEVPQTPETETCSRCDGYGVTKNPTRSPHHETSMCGPCGGQGYVKITPQQPSVVEFPNAVFTPAAVGNGVNAPCSRCGAPNLEGLPHFCNPVAQP